jgi:hypothetical protein
MRLWSNWVRVDPKALGHAGLRDLLSTELELHHAEQRRAVTVHLTALASVLVALEAWWPQRFAGPWRTYFLGTWGALAVVAVCCLVDEIVVRRRRERLLDASPPRGDDEPGPG